MDNVIEKYKEKNKKLRTKMINISLVPYTMC